MNREKEMTKIALRALDDKKAMDVKVIDIHEVSVLADYFVIASRKQPESGSGYG